MFNKHRTKGVFLLYENRGESNRFLTAYTSDFGKIRLFAKSIRKKDSKLRSGAEFFSLNEIEFIEGRNYKTLTDIKTIDSWKSIRKNLTTIAFACKACEDLDSLIKEEQKDERIWFLLEGFLRQLNQEKKSLSIFLLYYRFVWKLFNFLGYGPELHNCVLCAKNIEKCPVYFSFQEGGLIGNCCFNKEKNAFQVLENSVKILRFLLEEKKKLSLNLKVDSQSRKNLEALTEKYLEYLSLR